MKKIVKKVLHDVHSKTVYYGCTFYLPLKKYAIQHAYFENCSFREDALFADLEGCQFENCNFSRRFALDLSHQELLQIPQYVFSLTKLKALDLSYNSLSSIPPQIGVLSNLEGLNVSRNYLQTLPQEIDKLSNLRVLWLVANKMKEFPQSICALKKLQYLNISNNTVQTLPCGIQNLQALSILELEFNYLQNLPPQIGQLSSLRKLSISNKQQSERPKMSYLTPPGKINIYDPPKVGNKLKTLPQELFTLPRLEFLDVSGTYMTIPTDVEQLKSLRFLIVDSRVYPGENSVIHKLLPNTFIKPISITPWEFDRAIKMDNPPRGSNIHYCSPLKPCGEDVCTYRRNS
ncbi:leucine-rich repeat domain-containing protein [Candidatus Uabimicrobium amorphum]|uniref:Disease resistance R13L4/SHOC-2-like LRR domain-containing protein n=1 Tax=Uabimicrobium amorphum TaxID=2596890 RepID=A0A5S9IS46_UABAM|nr:hypothetical protein [Candidatus Uabimicrobium amorphum]BBM86596.1 hypothetical protein UABAM_04982 [Candidatus Uabimicrobium amorphum]